MLFSIITPTHKRSSALKRAVISLLQQTYHSWEMIIINDSPSDTSYDEFHSTIQDPRVRYYKNDTNQGNNYTRNRGLDLVSADSRWVIFLDDDDYLSPDALETFYNLIRSYPKNAWFVTNRAYTDGRPITRLPKSEREYNYTMDYLILRRWKGDATHCIERKHLVKEKIHFLRHVKQADEWFFFFWLGTQKRAFYHDHNSTITDGYDSASGLNFRKRSRTEQLRTLAVILYEASHAHLLLYMTLWIYMLMRCARIIIKS